MVAVLLTRGPATAIALLTAVASLTGGVFFTALRNSVIDCSSGSSTHKACLVSVVETTFSALITVGAAGGAIFIGLTSPTPRDLSGASALFRLDGQDIDWHEGMGSHRFGLNRTLADPAVVEYQLNSTSHVAKYLSYQTEEGHLVMRHDTGIDVAHGLLKRGTCRAYIDTVIFGDDLRASELASAIPAAQYEAGATALVDHMINFQKDYGCIELQALSGATATGNAARLAFGASCSHSIPNTPNCRTADYNLILAKMTES
ncbi:uncharacterized protein M421DRAFT_427052 [Didymella exigua CBS 183.55]|uniref:Uncharacterized protein n=1 Tax=Didymella exigua CBS 183.55 TaxID=1150837 RepID=A0A6A5R5M7_9PLEO|nr:uncharacterized protein M421DRAFT_427052 [Didymella exigua CBS 183.55]KAF1922304.1 hypothetical protein M421DRAFT_427052 [Didymella exigua CBS 183.55]